MNRTEPKPGPRRPRSRGNLIAAIAFGVAAVVVGVAAVVSTGYHAERKDLGDGSVWIVNAAQGLAGRANTLVDELNSVVDAGGAVQIAQRGRNVLLLDSDRAALKVVDPVGSRVVDTVAAPPGVDSIGIAGSRAVLVADGDVWLPELDRLESFDATREPALSFGADALVVVDDAGMLFAYSPTSGELARVDAARSETVLERVRLDPSEHPDALQLTATGGKWALFDATDSSLRTARGTTDLADRLAGTGSPRLQRASSAVGPLLIASTGGLLAVEDGRVEVLVDGRAGEPAAPARVADCEYAAWNDGGAWSRCGGTDRLERLERLPGSPQLRFDDNGRDAVLTDVATGRAWSASQGYRLIDNWDDLEVPRDDDRLLETDDADEDPAVEKAQTPPVAVDDELGARPGRITTLPLLVNDYDANDDALVVDAVADVEPAELASAIQIVGDGQSAQLDLPEGATGTVRFVYTISDGRGGSASANAVVAVRGPDENGAPVQARPSSLVLEPERRAETDVLVDWIDPDGDPVYLAAAEADGADEVARRADGRVTVADRSGVGRREVALTVSDGTATGGGRLDVEVVAPGTAPLVAEPFVVRTAVGEDVEVAPLAHVRGGTEQVRLTAVPPPADAEAPVDFEDGTFRFRSSRAGTHLLEYSVAAGAKTATGVIRVEVAPEQGDSTIPITVPHAAFVGLRDSVDVDVLATDIDPGGRVLIITGIVEPLPPEVQVEVIEHRLLRVTLDAPVGPGSVRFDYRVSNGLGEAIGSVDVVDIAKPAVVQPPVALDDTATARAGDVITIPVLDNDRHPDDEPLSLDDVLVEEPAAGLAFADGDSLRYLAPAEPGEYRAVYRVRAADDQWDDANVTVVVRAADAAANAAPRPETVEARALAGETVRIRIPLDGIDADGDSVRFLGAAGNPERGAVVETGADWLDYTAGEYSPGTDRFEYTVVDSFGARATGVVRVGIADRLDGARDPVAVADAVAVRPGRTMAVQVLANDSDPDGDPLALVDVEAVDGAPPATAEDGLVVFRARDAAGEYRYRYTVENERGGRAGAYLLVVVDPDAPLPAPVAHDTVLALEDVLDRVAVDVDVLADVFFAEGSADALDVRLVPGYADGARVLPDGALRIEVRAAGRTVPFVVANPDDPSRAATALVHVPGRDDALPQLRPSAPRIVVVSGEEVRIDLEEQVVAASGRPVRLADRDVLAVQAADEDLVVDERTLRYRSRDDFFGPASISFTVTDGARDGDPEARTATLVLPITVEPAADQPPSFTGGRMDIEPGQTKSFDLERLTVRADPSVAVEFSVKTPIPDGFGVELSGSTLRVSAAPDVPRPGLASLYVGVAAGGVAGSGGRIDLVTVPSTKPLADAVADRAVALRGRTTSIDVLANDESTNPFPGTPLVVTDVLGADRGELPAGVGISPSPDGSVLEVAVAADAKPGDAVVRYRIQDATGEPSRRVWGTATVSVQDRPDPAASVRVTGFDVGSLDVAFEPGAANNSPITGYLVELVDPSTGRVLQRTACSATRCSVATPGEGRENGVVVQVRAVNAIGESDAAAAVGVHWSDAVPAAPRGLRTAPLDGALRIAWRTVPADGGSPVERYVVDVGGTPQEFAAEAICGGTECAVEWGGLANGQQYRVSVSARNQAAPEFAVWNSASIDGLPFGAPIAGGISTAGDALAGTVTVAWDAFAANGDPVAGYYVQRLSGASPSVPTGAQACSVTSPAPGTVVPPSTGGAVAAVVAVDAGSTTVTFSDVAEGARDSFVVWGYNGAGCVRTDLTGIVVRPAPTAIGGVASDMRFTDSGLAYDRYISGVGGDWASLRMRAVDPDGVPIPGSERTFAGTGWARETLDRPYGESVRFQIRGCASWGSCGPWSAILPADARPSLSFDVPGRAWDAATRTWTWSRDPDNGGLPAEYRCGAEGENAGRRAQTQNSCTVESRDPSERVWLDVRIGGVTARITNG